MINLFKNSLKELWNLSRWEFFVKYLLPFVLVFFAWALIGNLIEITYSKENLVRVTDKILSVNNVITKVVNKPLYKAKKHELRLYLENQDDYFRLNEKYKYENFIDKLKKGDSVTVFFRPKYLVPIGMGRQKDIYQLESGNKVLFDISARKKNSKGIVLVSSIALLIFGTLRYVAKKQKVAKSYR